MTKLLQIYPQRVAEKYGISLRQAQYLRAQFPNGVSKLGLVCLIANIRWDKRHLSKSMAALGMQSKVPVPAIIRCPHCRRMFEGPSGSAAQNREAGAVQ